MARSAALIVVDTGVWADWFNGQPSPHAARLDAMLEVEDVALTPLILTEVLQGFRTDGGFERARIVLTSLPILDLDVDGHVEAARLFRSMRRRGVTVRGTADCLIAQTCILADAPLLSGDRDFVAIARHSQLRLHPA
jgi:hypothetical protein